MRRSASLFQAHEPDIFAEAVVVGFIQEHSQVDIALLRRSARGMGAEEIQPPDVDAVISKDIGILVYLRGSLFYYLYEPFPEILYLFDIF